MSWNCPCVCVSLHQRLEDRVWIPQSEGTSAAWMFKEWKSWHSLEHNNINIQLKIWHSSNQVRWNFQLPLWWENGTWAVISRRWQEHLHHVTPEEAPRRAVTHISSLIISCTCAAMSCLITGVYDQWASGHRGRTWPPLRFAANKLPTTSNN